MYFDLTSDLLATHLLVECLCWAPRDAVASFELMGEGRARVSWKPATEPLRMARLLTGVPAPGPPRAFDEELACGGGWAIVVASCLRFDALIRDEAAEWGQRFEEGEPVTEFEVVGEGGESSVLFDLELDSSLLPDVRFNRSWLVEWARTVDMTVKVR